MKALFEEPASAKAAFSSGAPVYLPVNPIEYHGPHLSLLNDHLISVGLAGDLHAELASLHGGSPLHGRRDATDRERHRGNVRGVRRAIIHLTAVGATAIRRGPAGPAP